MPCPVHCPICGADGTSAANEVIAFTLSKELSVHHAGQERMLLLAVMGCLITGIVGVIKASTMTSGVGVLLCLWSSVLAFGVAIGVYFWKHASHSPGLQKKSAPRPVRHAPVKPNLRVPIRPDTVPGYANC